MKKILLFLFVLVFLSVLAGILAKAAEETDQPSGVGGGYSPITTNTVDSGLTPDSPFYFLKTWKESIQTFFTFGAENKAKQFLHLSEVRLAEYQKMMEKGKTEIAQRTLEKYEKQLNRALEKAEEAKEEGEDVEKLKEGIGEKILKHQEVLESVLEKVPEEAKKGVEKAIEASRKGFEKAIEAVSGEKKEKLEQKAEKIKERSEEKTEIEPGIPKGKETR